MCKKLLERPSPLACRGRSIELGLPALRFQYAVTFTLRLDDWGDFFSAKKSMPLAKVLSLDLAAHGVK